MSKNPYAKSPYVKESPCLKVPMWKHLSPDRRNVSDGENGSVCKNNLAGIFVNLFYSSADSHIGSAILFGIRSEIYDLALRFLSQMFPDEPKLQRGSWLASADVFWIHGAEDG